MYAKCGSMVNARLVFDDMNPHSCVVSWNSLILGYAENGQGIVALNMFKKMRKDGPAPDSPTFVAALKACISLAVKGRRSECRQYGKEIHAYVVECDCHNVYVQSTLIDMYCKCGSIVEARQVFNCMKFPNVVSWTALILGYADNGQGLNALDLFSEMKARGPPPDAVAFVAALKGCISLAVKGGRLESIEWGKEIHEHSVRSGCGSDVYLQSTLIDMYAKCGSMVEARQVFDGMKHPNVVSWTALILGYADNEESVTALDLFTRMRSKGPTPDAITLSAALKACGLLGRLELGIEIHMEIDRDKELDVVLVTGLVDFYAKCGCIVEARRVFDSHSGSRNILTWNALLAGFSCCGDYEIVFQLFEAMKNAGFEPNDVTFLCMLKCCSHAGLVEKGKHCFDSISTKYNVVPTLEHYTCMLDNFGRANKLDHAMALLNDMPHNPNDVTWKTILSACRKWKNVGLGRLAFQSLVKCDDKEGAGYVLMGYIYGSGGMVHEKETVNRMRKAFKISSKPAQTCWTNEIGETMVFIIEFE